MHITRRYYVNLSQAIQAATEELAQVQNQQAFLAARSGALTTQIAQALADQKELAEHMREVGVPEEVIEDNSTKKE